MNSRPLRICVLLGILLIGAGSQGWGQVRNLSDEDLEYYHKQIRQIVSFVEFSFNTIGSEQSSSREKSIIINQSYLKVFKDETVQVEDDLDPNRTTVTQKDVQNYLKDIDFFYKNVRFGLVVENITHSINDDNELFFTVELSRDLNGTTVKGAEVQNTLTRYMEVNLDNETQELKIASIYSTTVNLTAQLYEWWNSISLEWRLLFADEIFIQEGFSMRQAIEVDQRIGIGDTLYVTQLDTIVSYRANSIGEILRGDDFNTDDSVYYILRYDTVVLNTPRLAEDLQKVVDKQELDISNRNIQTLEPLRMFKRLRKLNAAFTGILSLDPIKNLRRITELNIDHTLVESLEPLQFGMKVEQLNCQYTFIKDLGPLQYVRTLTHLDISGTPVINLRIVSQLPDLTHLECDETLISNLNDLSTAKKLKYLDCSSTGITTLIPIQGLTQLEELRCTRTLINTLEPLSKLPQLQALYCEQTQINSLAPLNGISSLAKVFCDKTQVSEAEANRFMQLNPSVLVIHQSAGLESWWSDMSPQWQAYFQNTLGIPPNPDRAQLQLIANVKEIDISRNTQIDELSPLRLLNNLERLNMDRTLVQDLTPLIGLRNLRYLSFSYTNVADLSPLRSLKELTFINFEFTPVQDLAPIAQLFALEEIQCDRTQIKSVAPLINLPVLRRIYCDQAPITRVEAEQLMKQRPDILIIYRTEQLNSWWRQLPDSWQVLLRNHVSLTQPPTREELHSLVALSSIFIEGNRAIMDLSPLKTFSQLKELTITGSAISNLEPLADISTLERLTINESPVRNLKALTDLDQLRHLNIANTPIRDLEDLNQLPQLESLNCSGTQINNLKPIRDHQNLNNLNFSNTYVKKIKFLKKMPALKQVTCYNTRIPPSKIRKFQDANPDITVTYY